MGVLSTGNWSIGGRTATGKTGVLAENTYILHRRRHVELKLSLASGTLPAGSVLTLPGAGSVGLIRNLDRYVFDRMTLSTGDAGAGASGNVFFTYNATGNKITFYRQPNPGVFASGTGRTGVAPLATTVNLKALTFYVTAFGW